MHHGIDVDSSFTLLRTHARNHNRTLVDVAHTVLTDPAGIPELTRHGRSHPIGAADPP